MILTRRMNRTCFFCFLGLLLFRGQTFAQVNLVMNPGFEDTIQCVAFDSRFQGYVADWRGGNGEYFSEYCQGALVEVPLNGLGFQYPHSGFAYAGIYMFALDNIQSHHQLRDYIEAKLSSQLQSGKRYYVNAYVSLANRNQYVGPVQFRFTPDTLVYNQYVQPTNNAITYGDLNLLSDTLNWINAFGFYTANGTEQHLVIGNFMYDSLTPMLHSFPNAPQTSCYYFIDDVAVYEVNDAHAGKDTTICLGDSVRLGGYLQPGVKYRWTNINNMDSTSYNPWVRPATTTSYVLSITDTSGYYYPGILADTITVLVDSCKQTQPSQPWFIATYLHSQDHFIGGTVPPGLTFQLYDARGRLAYESRDFENEITAGLFVPGVYLVKITTQQGETKNTKILISR